VLAFKKTALTESSPEAPKIPAPSSPSPVRPAAPASPQALKDIRSLKDEKKPTSAAQMACIAAFYLQKLAPEAERKESVSASDLEKYFKQAGFRLPQRVQQVLPDAKGSGYMDSAGRGEYKLNAVGYNLVVHNLPASTTEN